MGKKLCVNQHQIVTSSHILQKPETAWTWTWEILRTRQDVPEGADPTM